MRDSLLGIIIAVIFASPAWAADRVDLDEALHVRFADGQLQYQGSERIAETFADNQSMDYVVLDFRLADNASSDAHLQANIHTICTAVLRNTALVRQLVDQGVDMVSVAFDSNSQYDCL